MLDRQPTGYVKLWRKTINSAIFADPDLFKLWCLCLMKATHKEHYDQIDGIKEPVKVCPGQFITGRFALHRDYYPRKKRNQKSPLTLWKWMQILENLGNINIKSNNKFSIITIVNWHTYQCEGHTAEQQKEQQANNRLTTDEQQTNTNKNDKECKRNTICPEDAKKQKVPYQEIIDYFNDVTGKSYRHGSKSTRRLIDERYKDGFTVDDFKDVIDHKHLQWSKDAKMCAFVRPETLFGKKFESYLNEIPQ